MTKQIVKPKILKALREQRGLTQSALHEKTKVGLATIKRIESSPTDYSARSSVVDKLADALKVAPQALASEPPESAAKLQEAGYRRLTTIVDGETALAFQAVERIYGLSYESQVLMAPLFAALLAEGSLAWRRERLSAILDAASRMRSEAEGHLSFATSLDRVEEGADAELSSIEKNDVFATEIGDVAFDHGFDPSKNNPFADYLRKLAAKIAPGKIELDTLMKGFWKIPEGLPDYEIGSALISEITGSNELAGLALLRGYAALKDIPTELLGLGATPARVNWLIDKVPSEVQQKWEDRPKIKIDLGDLGLQTNDGSED